VEEKTPEICLAAANNYGYALTVHVEYKKLPSHVWQLRRMDDTTVCGRENPEDMSSSSKAISAECNQGREKPLSYV
jgi:hypothetical protein